MLRVMLIIVLFAIVGAAASGADQEMTLDDFEYDSEEAAREAWVPDEDSIPVSLMEHNGGTALQMNADFTVEASRRAVYDHEVQLDLSQWGRFTMDMYVDDPGLFSSFTIYFRSGDGWYGAGLQMPRKGWGTVSFSRSEFRVEDDPAGWDQIDGIRLSAWRGAPRTGFCAVDNLVAHRESRVIVMGTHTIEQEGGEARAVQQAAETVSNILADAGVLTSTIGDEDVEAGALENYEFAIFPYNPDMSEAEVAAIAEYVAGGGHIMAFYSLPEGLGEVLGIQQTGWTQREYEGQFSEIRFEEPGEFVGLPEAVEQDSWNVTIVEPIEGQGRVLGWWYDDAGENTGIPAFTASDAGLFMSHILLSSDRQDKQRMMVSMLGRYLPEIWPEVAEASLEAPDQVGHILGMDEAIAWIENGADRAPHPAEVRAALGRHRDQLARAREHLEAGEYPETVDVATEAWEALGEAYGLAHTPRDAEFRAWWNHSGTGAHDSWEESMQNLSEGGFNAIVPNMWWGGVALYDSEYLPHHPVVAERGDQIVECLEAAKRYGIEVHPWKVNWNLGSAAPDWFVEQLREEGRLQQSFDGEEIRWLCPSDERNFELELNTMLEVALNYDVDGVHFDYIRYPGPQGCFCERCHRKFEAATGLEVENWPEDTRENEEVREAWVQWRCDNISRLVEATAEGVRAVKPDCKISAAVFSSYPNCRESIGQDWAYWIEQGWLDFVCPMDYTTSDATFAARVASQMQHVAGRVPLYPGIGAWRLDGPDRVAGQAEIARNLGADGFILFNYGGDLPETVAPVMGRAMLAEPAVHPHNAPAYRFELTGELTRQRTWGLHVDEGATVSATVRRGEAIAGRDFGEVEGHVLLQDVDGRTVEQLGVAPANGEPVQVSFSADSGLHRIAVEGTCTAADGTRQRFVTRSVPIVFGELSEDIRPLL